MLLNGAVVEFSIAILLEYVPLVNGPVVYEVTTPKEVERHLIVTDLGYNGYGTEVHFSDGNGIVQDGAFRTDVRVYIPIDTAHLGPRAVVPTELSILMDDLTVVSTSGTSQKTTAEVVVAETVSTTATTVIEE